MSDRTRIRMRDGFEPAFGARSMTSLDSEFRRGGLAALDADPAQLLVIGFPVVDLDDILPRREGRDAETSVGVRRGVPGESARVEVGCGVPKIQAGDRLAG